MSPSIVRSFKIPCSRGKPLLQPRPQASQLPSLLGGPKTQSEDRDSSVRAEPDQVPKTFPTGYSFYT